MTTEDRIIIHPDICNGRPTVRNTRIAVQTILEFLSAGEEIEAILLQYPALSKEDIYACLQFLSHKVLVLSSELHKGDQKPCDIWKSIQ